MQTTDTLQYPVHTYVNKIRAKTIILMESITTTTEEYLNILNKLLELVPSMSAINVGEADMILADGELWKSDIK